MTGRDLIIYILQNGLEDELVIDNGSIIGFVTPLEVAAKLNVGIATVYAWIWRDEIAAIRIGDSFFIPANFKSPLEIDKFQVKES